MKMKKIEINDEKCNKAENLYFNTCEFEICEYPLNATLYTFPGLEVKYSRKDFSYLVVHLIAKHPY